MSIDLRSPRRLPKQDAWYYLPDEDSKTLRIYHEVNDKVACIKINAPKLLRELKAAIEVKP